MQDSGHKFRFSIYAGFIISAVGIASYWNSFDVPFQFDDYGYSVLKNKEMSSFSTVKELWMSYPARFIGLLTFSLNLSISRESTFGFHIVNFSIHLITSILTFYLVRTILWLTLVSFPQIEEKDLLSNPKNLDCIPEKTIELISLFASLIFVSHPLYTSVVTYITQRFTGLCTMFYLGSLFCYIKYCIYRSYNKFSKYLFFAGAFLLALLANYTKENSATIPASWILVEVLFFNLSIKNIKFRKPAILACAFMLFLPFITLLLGNNISTREVTSTDAPAWEHYFITQISVILTYLRLFLWPVNQSIDYSYPLFKSISDIEILIKILVHGLLFLISYNARRKWKGITFGILFFYITILPDSSIVPMPDLIIEHRAYLPSAGIIILFSSVILRSIILNADFNLIKRLSFICLTGILLIFVLATNKRNEVWESPETLWLDVIKKSPDKLRGHLNLGKYYLNTDQYDKSIKYYRIATMTDPSFSGSFNNLGVAHAKQGHVAKSIELFNQALAKDPDKAIYYHNLSHAYQVGKHFEKAIETLRSCISKYPEDKICNIRLARVYREIKDYKSAISTLNTILKTKKDTDEIYLEIALSYKYSGDKEAAKAALGKALLLNPGSHKANNLLHEIESTNKQWEGKTVKFLTPKKK